jgi:hypothetical protein
VLRLPAPGRRRLPTGGAEHYLPRPIPLQRPLGRPLIHYVIDTELPIELVPSLRVCPLLYLSLRLRS